MGSGYEPNVEGIRLFLDQIQSYDGWDNVEFLIIGEVCEPIDNSIDNVHLAGFIDDIGAHLSAGDVFLNPIVSGSGTNIKLFDYFAKKRPVITTPFGARGLDFTNSEEIILSDIDSFIDSINWVKENPHAASQIAQNAKEKALNKYTWEKISTRYRNALRKLTGETEY
jgi:glycosyltransferase involved in cell wall biosynthesis